MAKGSKKSPGDGLVFSTNREWMEQHMGEPEEEISGLAPTQQNLIVRLDRKQRAGKSVTLVTGFVGNQEEIASLSKWLKTFCGVGGSVKDGEILLQGDFREKVLNALLSKGYKAKRGN